MAMLLIEYRVDDYAGWKAVFDQDPMGRSAQGVTRHCIYRDSEDPNHLVLSLEFATADEAHTFRKALEPVWDMSGARRAWVLQEANR